MYYGDDILILETGVRVRPEALHPIGITNNSQCWGIQIASAPEKGKPPHLLVSAFSPENWHILFRIEIELQNKIGAMYKVSEILENHDFDILSTQCAPSGHSHASWHIIGVALDKEKEATQALANSIAIFEPNQTAYDESNNKFREKLTEIFSVPLMKYSKELERIITREDDKESDEKKKFLHTRFRDNNTLLYKDLERFFNEDEAELLTRIKEHELYRPVESRWLQQMAVFRSYSQAAQKGGINRHYARWNNPILFKYDASLCLLEPLGNENKGRYIQVLNTCIQNDELPIRAIAAFNHEEHYLRIVLPESDQKKNSVSIQLEYSATFGDSSNASSKGLLKEVAKILKDCEVDMNYISNTTSLRTDHREEGSLSLIGTPKQDLRDKTLEKLEYRLKNIDKIMRDISFSKISVSKVGAKKIFISTKFDLFKQEVKPELKKHLCDLARKYGLDPVWGGPENGENPSGKKLDILQQDILEKILGADVFLQIIPEGAEEQTWLLYELGIARGAELPCEICVDETEVKNSPPKVAEGSYKYTFITTSDSKVICKRIEPAFQSLSNYAYK